MPSNLPPPCQSTAPSISYPSSPQKFARANLLGTRATSAHDQPAVHIQDLSGDVRCVVRGEEDHRGGYLLRFPRPPQRNLLQEDLHLVRCEPVGHPGFDVTW